jgi:hypothetical protein
MFDTTGLRPDDTRERTGEEDVMKAAAGGFLAVVCIALALSCDYDDLDGIPAGFADGVDNQVYFEGTGPELGVAETAARSDHNHDAVYVLRAGDTMTGTLAVTPPADTEALVVRRGDVAQAKNIQEWQDETGAVALASVGPDGSIVTDGSITVAGTIDGPSVAQRPKITKITTSGTTSDTTVGTTFELLKTIGTFTKDYDGADTIIEVTLSSNITATGSVGDWTNFQIRIDGAADPDGTGRAICRLTATTTHTPIMIHTVFPGLSAGNHTVSIWLRGNCSEAIFNVGNYSVPLVVKEIWNR